MEKDGGNSKAPMTDRDRLELAAKLDKELDDFIGGLEKRQYTEGWPEDKWKEEMEKHPFFMNTAPEPGQELHPLIEGLQNLKYDPEENTAEELAVSYKEDGNFSFKHKKYRMAIIAYTEGIKQKCGNVEIEATLYNNRAAANYQLENYRSCLTDCKIALKLKSDYDKVLVRAANCCYHISKFDDCITYCDRILAKQPENSEILKLRQNAVREKKSQERDKRKALAAAKRKDAEHEIIVEEVRKRGIRIDTGNKPLTMRDLTPTGELADKHLTFMDNKLIWPVLFLYPEYGLLDFVEKFQEDVTVADMLATVFETFPEWDVERKYVPENLNVYFTDESLLRFSVNVEDTLDTILKMKHFLVRGGTPEFNILVRNSEAELRFLNEPSVFSR